MTPALAMTGTDAAGRKTGYQMICGSCGSGAPLAECWGADGPSCLTCGGRPPHIGGALLTLPAMALCRECIGHIGGAGGGPDLPWRERRRGEACEAEDCAEVTP